MTKLQFTPAERISFIHQFEILSKLEPEQKEYYERLITIVSRGYTQHYDEIRRDLHVEELSVDVAEFTLNVLILFERLQYSVENNPELSRFVEDVKFRGFDGNNEAEYLHYARFLGDEPAYRKLNVGNSHMPTVARYGRMLEQFERSGKDDYTLTAKQIEDILAAGKPGHLHPVS